MEKVGFFSGVQWNIFSTKKSTFSMWNKWNKGCFFLLVKYWGAPIKFQVTYDLELPGKISWNFSLGKCLLFSFSKVVNISSLCCKFAIRKVYNPNFENKKKSHFKVEVENKNFNIFKFRMRNSISMKIIIIDVRKY